MADERRTAPAEGGGPADASESRAQLRGPWLVRVRWGAVAAQVLAIVVARAFLNLAIPLLPLLSLSAVTAVTNLVLARRVRRQPQQPVSVCWAILSFDTVLLTGLLYGSGGPSNPFSVFYLVQITIASVILSARWTWTIAALAVVCYGTLFWRSVPLEMAEHDHSGDPFSLHLQGMWLALTAAAGLTAYFVTRLSSLLARREAEVAAVRKRAAKAERLAALTTLAAGAAHELGTPMATIAVTARELERGLAEAPQPGAERLLDDARLIRSELDRCRRILQGMSGESSDPAGEAPARVTAGQLAAAIVGTLPARDASRIQTRCVRDKVELLVPVRAVGSIAVNLIRNALEASPAAAFVTLSVDTPGNELRLSVRDSGAGMAPDVLAHAGEPFFTTKAPGQGLGLGLFLARTYAERLGGRLVIESSPGAGTEATLIIPVQTPADGTEARDTR